MNRDMKIAEAVRDAQWRSDAEKLTDDELAAIISSVEAPEPVGIICEFSNGALMVEAPIWTKRVPPIGTKLYAEPPAVQINQQLLEALKTAERYVHDDFIAAGIGQAIAAAEKELGNESRNV